MKNLLSHVIIAVCTTLADLAFARERVHHSRFQEILEGNKP